MLHELKQGPDHLTKIILQAAKLKRNIPKAMVEGATLFPWLAVFYNAFLDLMGDRNWEQGPITWQARRLWALDNRLDTEATRLLHVHVKALDLAFLKWKRDNQPKREDGNRGKSRGNTARLQPTR